MIIAQISDCHLRPSAEPIFGRIDTEASLGRLVQRINALRPQPDVVLVTGDLTDRGRPESLNLAIALLDQLDMHWLPVAGNHYERQKLYRLLPGKPVSAVQDEFVQYLVDDFPVALVVLDTVQLISSRGKLCSKRLSWLEETLQQITEKPVMLALHHPPFETGIEHVDEALLEGLEAFEEVVRGHSQVRRIVAGHLHRTAFASCGGVIASTAPSVAYQFVCDLYAGAPARVQEEAAAFHLHNWNGKDFTTHHVLVETHETWALRIASRD